MISFDKLSLNSAGCQTADSTVFVRTLIKLCNIGFEVNE